MVNTAAETALSAWKSALGETRLEHMVRISNPLWKVICADGRSFVLKQLPQFAPGAGPVEEFRVLSYLQGVGIPVVPPIITDAGCIRTRVDDRAYALLPFIEHDEPGPDSAPVAFAIGAAIGRLDRALANCPWPVDSFVDDPAHDIFEEAVAGLPGEVTESVAPLVPRLQQAVLDLPAQRTDGDCNAGNVLVKGTRVVGFIDVDHLSMGPRMRDLSYYLASRLRPAGPPERDALVGVLGDYVTGFQEANPLPEREAAAIVPLVLAAAIGGASWCLHGWTPDPRGYRANVDLIAWLVPRLDDLVTAAGTPPF